GAPSAMDAIMAARMSELAIDALLDDRDNRIIGYVDGALRGLPYKEAKEITYPIQEEQYELVSILSS
ncbi:MAG: ATP-dependent 6-phosphofructokinase, partial [Veillonella sp.]|nr:ATP-dependent 6-phosphofructokinase [Veillonella sp.]